MDVIGKKLTDVVEKAWMTGFAVQSNFARSYAVHVAIAACKGLITTQCSRDTFGNKWRVTVAGMNYLQNTTLGGK